MNKDKFNQKKGLSSIFSKTLLKKQLLHKRNNAMICRGEYCSGAGEALVSMCSASLLLLQQNGAKSNFLFWIKCMYRKQFSVKIFIQIHHFFLSLNSFFLRRSPFQTGQSRVADPDPTFSKKNLNYSGSNQNSQIRIQLKHPDPNPTKTPIS